MFKSEMEKMVKRAGGLLEDQEIESHKVGDSWEENNGWGYEGTRPKATFEIVAFAPPAARGRIQKWDVDADSPSVILRKSSSMGLAPNDEYHIRSVQLIGRKGE